MPAIGGRHQFAHFLPVAFELQRRGTFDVTIFVPDADEVADIENMATALGYPLPTIVTMDLPTPLGRRAPRKLDKLARLLVWARRIRAGNAILCAERTSTLLKRLPGRCPKIVHIPHGAGDRAVGFEKRFRYFDYVVVAGQKDRQRLLAEGLVNEDRCAASGPVKISASLRRHAQAPRLFDNDRPVILYNPHFSEKLSSADSFTCRLIEAVAGDDRYNLVVAPHVRLAQNWDDARRKTLEAMAVTGRVIIDLGSCRSIDMTYTLGADLYVGDVSSQVYEFLVQPRPCLFVNSHDAKWNGNADYAMWQFGDVIQPDCDVLDAIGQAFQHHPRFKGAQMARAQAALDGLDWNEDGEAQFSAADPIARAAVLIEKSMKVDHAMPASGRAAIPLQSGDLSFR
ncbi:glycosyl transferase [Novosphingobium sp. PhB165]|uniref:glycosyl transferase n=1 Tax=Novosphingobium sp. PhB165 TaxID=2485105 RepID=UPI0010470891|nr:glycosyl transferase [Novosphingobium sp. PhB165]